MDTRLQSASTNTVVKARTAKNSANPPRAVEVSELILTELAARRARLQELLRLIRLEAAREMKGQVRISRRACRRQPPMSSRAARAD